VFPENEKAVAIRNFVASNSKKGRVWIVLATLALPVVAVIWLLIWVFSDELGVSKSQNLQRQNAKMVFVQQALLRIFNDQPDLFPIVAPETIPIQAVASYKGVAALRVCVGRKNVTEKSDDAKIFKLHLNSEVARYFEQGRFPIPQNPNLAGVDLRFKIIDIHACKGYWEIYTGPISFVDHLDSDFIEVDESDEDF
jgi:hypothetical protein